MLFDLIRVKFCFHYLKLLWPREKAMGPQGRNIPPRGWNFALNGTQGEVGRHGETHFHSVTTQKTQAVVTIYYHCIEFLLPFNGNSNV